jgi:hypothetical protein
LKKSAFYTTSTQLAAFRLSRDIRKTARYT